MNRLWRLLILFPGIIAAYLLLGAILAFSLDPLKIDITSQSILGTVLILILVPVSLVSSWYVANVPLDENSLVFSLFGILLVVLFSSIYLFRKIKPQKS